MKHHTVKPPITTDRSQERVSEQQPQLAEGAAPKTLASGKDISMALTQRNCRELGYQQTDLATTRYVQDENVHEDLLFRQGVSASIPRPNMDEYLEDWQKRWNNLCIAKAETNQDGSEDSKNMANTNNRDADENSGAKV